MAHILTPRKAAAGLGASKEGTHHFIVQRVTAIALVPLVLWFLIGLVAAFDGGYAGAQAFIGDPVNAVLLLLLVTAAFWHMQLGMQVIIEDYVHTDIRKIALLMANTFYTIAVGLIAVYAILKINFGL